MNFKEYWKIEKGIESSNEKLSIEELKSIRKFIIELEGKGLNSSNIIKHLQTYNKKLIELWKAQQVYWTETKAMDTKIVHEASKELEVKSYRVVLSPSACPICREKTSNGSKIFKNSDFTKSEYGHVPPFHPNCYCIVLPK